MLEILLTAQFHFGANRTQCLPGEDWWINPVSQQIECDPLNRNQTPTPPPQIASRPTDSNWELLAELSDRTVYWYPSRVTRFSNNRVRFLTLTYYDDPQPPSGHVKTGHTWFGHCDRGLIKLREYTHYLPDNEILENVRSEGTWTPTHSGSLAELMLSAACNTE